MKTHRSGQCSTEAIIVMQWLKYLPETKSTQKENKGQKNTRTTVTVLVKKRSINYGKSDLVHAYNIKKSELERMRTHQNIQPWISITEWRCNDLEMWSQSLKVVWTSIAHVQSLVSTLIMSKTIATLKFSPCLNSRLDGPKLIIVQK